MRKAGLQKASLCGDIVGVGQQRGGAGAGEADLVGRGVGPGFVHRDTQATGGGGGWGDGGLDPLAGGGVEAQHAN